MLLRAFTKKYAQKIYTGLSVTAILKDKLFIKKTVVVVELSPELLISVFFWSNGEAITFSSVNEALPLERKVHLALILK